MKLIFALILSLLMGVPAAAQGWQEVKARLLPDSSFAIVETDVHGRKHRHCPYREADGTINEDQLIWALGSLEREEWFEAGNEKQARQTLGRHYQRCHARLMSSNLPLSVDLNQAAPHQLVRLPGIGPVLAVRIIEYREQKAVFLTPDDIMKVEGIDRNKFAAIRHYIEIR